jgi:hypothetical protein
MEMLCELMRTLYLCEDVGATSCSCTLLLQLDVGPTSSQLDICIEFANGSTLLRLV